MSEDSQTLTLPALQPDPAMRDVAGYYAQKYGAVVLPVAGKEIPGTKVNDFAQLEEWRAQARALEGYLRDKELQGPMLATQRRCEAQPE